jgi:hypothetical protein
MAEMKVETTAGQMRIRIITTTRRTKIMTIDLSFLSKLYRYISSSTMCEQPALLASHRLLFHYLPRVYNNGRNTRNSFKLVLISLQQLLFYCLKLCVDYCLSALSNEYVRAAAAAESVIMHLGLP